MPAVLYNNIRPVPDWDKPVAISYLIFDKLYYCFWFVATDTHYLMCELTSNSEHISDMFAVDTNPQRFMKHKITDIGVKVKKSKVGGFTFTFSDTASELEFMKLKNFLIKNASNT